MEDYVHPRFVQFGKSAHSHPKWFNDDKQESQKSSIFNYNTWRPLNKTSTFLVSAIIARGWDTEEGLLQA